MADKIEVVIFDWAGTTIDFGCIAPLQTFMNLFESNGVPITSDEAKKPMGLYKVDHIRELFKMDRIRNEYINKFNHEPNEETVNEYYNQFEKFIFNELPKHTDILPGVIETVTKLRENGIKIGSTSGYTRKMMDLIEPLTNAQGFKPDFCVTSSEVPKSRPYPWMIFQNAVKFGIFDFSHYVKVGDTIADIEEGKNANVWSVGVLEGSSLLGLSKDEFEKISSNELEILKTKAKNEYLKAGADFVIDSLNDLPQIITQINDKLKSGELPGRKFKCPEQAYLLFTPGPLTTSLRVKLPMLTDWGSRENDFCDLITEVKKELLKFTTPSNLNDYEAVLMQGSGTYGVESVIGSAIPKTNSKFLVIINGRYGIRMAEIAEVLGINTVRLNFEETDIPDENEVEKFLDSNPEITHVGIIHSETTTGILNPLERFAKIIKARNKILIVDGMSSFGAVPFDVNQMNIDFAIGSANKGFQGVPGFCFIIAKRTELFKCEGNARSVSLDLYEQWKFSKNTKGSFRFTPPVHAIRSFYAALEETKEEGGLEARYRRFKENQEVLVDGMKKLGFKVIDLKGYQGPVITTFESPKCPKYNFNKFYDDLKATKFVIYPGKLTKGDTFRIGTIGEIRKQDVLNLLDKIKEVMFWDQKPLSE